MNCTVTFEKKSNDKLLLFQYYENHTVSYTVFNKGLFSERVDTTNYTC